jgi:hypothetical protein
MEYKVSELAEELGITENTVYISWIPEGLPLRRDKAGHIWIHGTAAAGWIKEKSQRSNEKIRMLDNQAYCMLCKKPVTIVRVTRRELWNAVNYRQYVIMECGHKGVKISRKINTGDQAISKTEEAI